MSVLVDFTSQSIDQLFDDAFYWGSGSGTTLGPYQVVIGTHRYVITPQQYDRMTVPLQRQATDESVEPGEQSLNIEGAWRRSQDNWFLGAGQLYLDNRFGFISVYVHSGETPSVRTRFWRSKGVNPWTEGALTLLSEYHKLKTGGSNPLCCAVGTSLFYWDGTHLYRSTSVLATAPVWTTITSPTAGAWPTIESMTTDGANLYLALGTHGVAKVASGGSAATTLRPGAATPSVAVKGTAGTTHYTYALVGTDAAGFKTLMGTVGGTTTGNAALSTTNYNLVTWTAVSGIVKWDVLRKTGTTWKSLVTTATGTSFTDNGSHTLSAYTRPTTTTDNFQASFVCYGNSFLLAGAGPELCNIAANGACTRIFTHYNTAFVWQAGCGSPGAIFVSGYAGNISELYGISLSTTTFGLAPPQIAGQVTNGEIIYALCYYEGILILSTSLGVRAGSVNGTSVTTGAVVTNLGASKCCVPWGAYVWFGISTFNETDGIWSGTNKSSGTGRLFLSEFSSPLLPAYTTDVLAPNGTTGTTTSVTVVGGAVLFCITGKGLYSPDGNLVAQGYLESGWVRYGTIETKILITATVRHTALPTGASVQLRIVPTAAPAFTLAASNVPGSIGPKGKVSAGNYVGEGFQVIPVLKRATTPKKGPSLRRWTCRAQVVSVRQTKIIVPLIWAPEIRNPQGEGSIVSLTLESERTYLQTLMFSGTPFVYQEGSSTYTAFIDQIEMKARTWTDTRNQLIGILFVSLLTVN